MYVFSALSRFFASSGLSQFSHFLRRPVNTVGAECLRGYQYANSNGRFISAFSPRKGLLYSSSTRGENGSCGIRTCICDFGRSAVFPLHHGRQKQVSAAVQGIASLRATILPKKVVKITTSNPKSAWGGEEPRRRAISLRTVRPPPPLYCSESPPCLPLSTRSHRQA